MAKRTRNLDSEINGIGSEVKSDNSTVGTLAETNLNAGNETGVDGEATESELVEVIEPGEDRAERNAEHDAPKPTERKRGRPRKNPAAKTDVDIEPKPKKGDKSKTVQFVAEYVVMANNMLAMKANAPVLIIDEASGVRIADPLIDVLALWGIKLDGTTNPYMRLTAALIGVYGMKVIAIAAMRQAGTQAPPIAPSGPMAPTNVSPFPTVHPRAGRVDLSADFDHSQVRQ